MTTTTTDRVEQILADRFADRVYDVRDGTVWVSGRHAHCRMVARRMVRDLHTHGIPCGLVREDDADVNGGVEFDFVDEDLSCHPEDDNLPGHHAVGETPAKRLVIHDDGAPDLSEFGSIGDTRDTTDHADDGLGVLVALAAVAVVAFASGFAVGWFL